MGLMLKLNLSSLLGPLKVALLRVLHLESQNRTYKLFYILKMY